ncbi:MAG: CBS domain-containing protein [Anaerolineales bacterium]|nr:CBS domain-containing protein [Anaerolineales bacterium]
MLVKDRMTPDPICGTPEMTVIEAQGLMAKHNIRHLPILDNEKNLVGLITLSSLRSVLPSDVSSFSRFEISYTLSRIKVQSIMIKDVITIDPDLPIEDAASLMAVKKIDALPVVSGDHLVGIMSGQDLFIAMAALLGTRNPGIRVTVAQPDQSGVIARLTTAIAKEGGYLSVCVGYYPEENSDTWVSVCKVENLDQDRLVDVISKLDNATILDIRQFQEQE